MGSWRGRNPFWVPTIKEGMEWFWTRGSSRIGNPGTSRAWFWISEVWNRRYLGWVLLEVPVGVEVGEAEGAEGVEYSRMAWAWRRREWEMAARAVVEVLAGACLRAVLSEAAACRRRVWRIILERFLEWREGMEFEII